MEIPFASASTVFRSYKVMPRSQVTAMCVPFLGSRVFIHPRLQNAHAYVNAAFAVEIDASSFTVTGRPSLVFGGVQAHDVRHIHVHIHTHLTSHLCTL